jgi:hypothetical protein
MAFALHAKFFKIFALPVGVLHYHQNLSPLQGILVKLNMLDRYKSKQ